MSGGIDVVVTGMGCLTPLGRGLTANWDGLLEGLGGIGPITRFDASPFAVQIAGEVDGPLEPPVGVDPRRFAYMDRCAQLTVIAAMEALAMAGIAIPVTEPERVGVVIGTAIGGIETVLRMHDVLRDEGPRWVSPNFLPNIIPDAPAGHVAIATGARGYNLAPVGACATGAQAVGEAIRAIRDGLVDVVITGGAEAPLTPLVLAGFIQMRALAPGKSDPSGACRPFDLDRAGFVCAEGSAILVLESAAHAEARGGRPLARLTGYGCTADAHDMAAPHPDSAGLVAAIRLALADSGNAPDEISYINPHGTGTPLGDRLEATALQRIFGEELPAISGVKGSVGHMMAAAGAFEAITCVQAIRHGVIPPTLNHDHPDPALGVQLVAGAPLHQPVTVALSTSMGLAGHNAALVVSEYGNN